MVAPPIELSPRETASSAAYFSRLAGGVFDDDIEQMRLLHDIFSRRLCRARPDGTLKASDDDL